MRSWSGEFELISGMKINLAYDPGADQIETEMIPPEELTMDEKQNPMGQYQGPMKFWATRVGPAPGTQLEDDDKENAEVPQEVAREIPKKAPIVVEQTKEHPPAPPPPQIN